MSDDHSNASFVEKINNKLQMVQEGNSVRHSCANEKNIKIDQKYAIDYSVCPNTAISNKSDPVMNGEINFKRKRPFICDTCGKTFKYNKCFIVHQKIHANPRPFICTICSKRFTCESQLAQHSVAHSNEKPYVCDLCMTSYKTRKGYVDHCKKHAGEKNYKCNVCEKAFLLRGQLLAHQVVHSDSMPYVCEICFASFKTKYSLKSHEVTHSDERKFKCELCYKTYKRKSQMSYHLLLHTGERPYSCDFCGMSFQASSRLKQHVLNHTKIIKEQNCMKCNKRLRGTAINEHIAKCKGDPKIGPFKCAVCNKAYKSLLTLKAHTKSHSNPKGYNYIYAVHKDINLT